MRMVFGVLSLLIVVAIVGVVAKRQLTSLSAPPVAASGGAQAAPVGTPRQQVEQFRQSVDSAVQQSRPVNDDTQ